MSLVRFRVISVDDSGPHQLVTGRGEGGEILERMYRPQQDGMSTVPEKDALGYALFAGGSRERGLVQGMETADHRPKNQAIGGKTIYGPKGQSFVLKPDGSLVQAALQGDQIIKPKPGTGKIYLGGDPAEGGLFSRVMTEDGPSSFVWAKVS